MAFRMAALNKTANGTWSARKVIPQDVRAEYQRLYGPAWEVKFSAPADVSRHEAKARCGEWIAEVETKINSIRAAAKGDGIDLTHKQALALAGEWRAWFIARHEDKTLVTPERTAQTVSDVWVSSARRVFKWGVDEGLLPANPFAKIKVTIPKTVQHREDKAFSDDEAKLILRAASKIKPKTTFERAQRWVTWLDTGVA